MDKKNESGSIGNETEAAIAKVKNLFDIGRLSEPMKELLESALATSPMMFEQAVFEVVTATALIVGEKEAVESAPELIRIIRDAARKRALTDRSAEFSGDIDVDALAKILELSLDVLCGKPTYNVNIILDTAILETLAAFYKSDSATYRTIMVRVKNIYIPSYLEISEQEHQFLNMIRKKHKVKLFHGPGSLEAFAESSKGIFVLMGGVKYATEANRLVFEVIRKGGIMICQQDLNFGYHDLLDIDQAVEESPAEEGSMFMLYKDNPIVKSIAFPPSFIMACCEGVQGMYMDSILVLAH